MLEGKSSNQKETGPDVQIERTLLCVLPSEQIRALLLEGRMKAYKIIFGRKFWAVYWSDGVVNRGFATWQDAVRFVHKIAEHAYNSSKVVACSGV